MNLHCISEGDDTTVRTSLPHYATDEVGQISNQTGSVKPYAHGKEITMYWNKIQVLNMCKNTYVHY